MFKGMKKVLAGLLAAAIALTPVSSVMAAGSPTISLGPVSKHGNTPATTKGKEMIKTVNTTNSGNAIVAKVNPTATSVTFTNISVKNGRYYYTDENSRKIRVGTEFGTISYKIGAVKKGAFVGATKVAKVTLGTKFAQGRLEYKCFAGAHSLRTIYIKARSIRKVEKNLFGNNVDTSKIIVYVPKATTPAQMSRFVEQFTRAGIKQANIRRSADF